MTPEIASILIYQAKAYGGPRRAGGFFADGFATGAGIASLTGGVLDLVNKKIVTQASVGGDQTKILGSAIENAHYSTFAAARAFDGSASTQWLSNQYNLNQSGVSWIGWDFGSGQSRDITSATIRQDSNGVNSLPIASVKVQWTDPLLGTWTDVPGSPFTLPADTSLQTLTWASVGAKRAYRFLANANTAVNGWAWGVAEATFNLAATPGNLVLSGALQYSQSVSSVAIAVEFNPIDAIAIGTDFKVEVTCNGSDYVEATFTLYEGQNGRTLAVSGDITCVAGGSFGYRTSTFGKLIEVAGVALNAS